MSKISINLSVNEDYVFPVRRMEDEYVATGLTVNSRAYVEIEQYCKSYTTCSDSTVRRLLKKVEHQRCNEFFIKLNGKIYVSPNITMLTSENFSKMGTINGNWETFLRSFEWDHFGCVSFKWSIKQKTAKERMAKFFDRLARKFKSAEIRIFYVCEENKTRDGYHTHFVLWTDITNKAEVKNFTENHFRGKSSEPFANTSIEKYDPTDGGIGYLLKEMSKNPDGYDYLIKNKS
jgi:disulfide oxidoreductase YuzD